MRHCHLCLGPCDAALHAATISLRAWLRARIVAYLEPVARGPKGPRAAHAVQTIGLVPK